MSRRCIITKKKPLTGNNVSHANNKTKRKYLPNLQQYSFWSETLQRNIDLKVVPKAAKTIAFNGGFDNWLVSSHNDFLDKKLKSIKKTILKRAVL